MAGGVPPHGIGNSERRRANRRKVGISIIVAFSLLLALSAMAVFIVPGVLHWSMTQQEERETTLKAMKSELGKLQPSLQSIKTERSIMPNQAEDHLC